MDRLCGEADMRGKNEKKRKVGKIRTIFPHSTLYMIVHAFSRLYRQKSENNFYNFSFCALRADNGQFSGIPCVERSADTVRFAEFSRTECKDNFLPRLDKKRNR